MLFGALQSFELDRADAAMEAALALRSVERSVEEVLLPSVDELGERNGFDSAPWAFAARWAADWLQRAQRLAPPPMRPAAVLIGDATRDDLDPDALALRALRLFSVRSGARVLVLPVSGVAGLVDVLRAFEPQVVVVAGAEAADDQVARWAYRVRSTTGAAADDALPPRTGRARPHRRPPARRVARRGAPPDPRPARRPGPPRARARP